MGRLTRLPSARSGRCSVLFLSVPLRRPVCEGSRAELSALRVVRLGVRRLDFVEDFDLSQKDRLARSPSARSGRRSVLSSLAPLRLPDCQGCRVERSALRVVRLGLPMLDFVQDFRHFSTGQADSLAFGALRPTLRFIPSCTPPSAGLSKAPTRVPRTACSAQPGAACECLTSSKVYEINQVPIHCT